MGIGSVLFKGFLFFWKFIFYILGGIFVLATRGKLKFGFWTSIFIVILMMGAIRESIQQGTPEPAIEKLGQITMGVDKELKENVNEFTSQALSGWNKFVAFLTCLGNLWFIYVLVLIFYKLFDAFYRPAAPFNCLIGAFGVLALMQILYGALTTGTFYWPFSGLWTFLKNLGYWLVPVERWVAEHQNYSKVVDIFL